MPDAVGEQPAQSPGESCRNEEVADAKRELAFGIEERQVYRHTGEKTALQRTEDQSRRYQPAIRLSDALQRGHNPPACGDECDPTARAEFLEDQVRRQLGEDVGDKEDGDGDLIAGAGQGEVRNQAIEARVAYVDAVEEGL